jgi:hypothetical protein
VSFVFLSAVFSWEAVATVLVPVTVTLHFRELVLPLDVTFAVIVDLPAFTPVTFPFLETVAMLFLLEDHFTVALFAAFFTDRVRLSPAMTVADVLLSFGFVAAVALVIGIIVKASARVIMSAKALFMIVFILFFPPFCVDFKNHIVFALYPPNPFSILVFDF